MWMFLTRDEKGFDGVYNYKDSEHSLRYFERYEDEHIVEIEELLKNATDNNPDSRPTIEEYKKRLIEWIEIYDDTDKSQASDWKFLENQLFDVNIPSSSNWTDTGQIKNILNIIGKTPAYNHMFFPDGGGLDFSYAKIAEEEGCIKMYDTSGLCYVVKPKKLFFEGFKENFKWNYFLLELDELTPVLENVHKEISEYLVEDTPAHYVSAKYSQYKVYDYESGRPLPNGFQLLTRYTKGNILIVMKTGPYNKIRETYDGRHGKCTPAQFRVYIEKLVESYLIIYNFAKNNDKLKKLSLDELEGRILNSEVFTRSPFNYNCDERANRSESKKYMNIKKSKEYIEQEYTNWNFRELFQDFNLINTSAIKFVFKFESPNSEFILDISKESNYLSVDGYIRELDIDSKKCYYIYDRKAAIELKDNIEERIIKILKDNNLVELEEYNKCFSIELIKCGNPTNLFTKEEIAEAIRNADDRFDNQLVIDENGYARVIQNCRIGNLFPVSHEIWNAGNVYVGKYSQLFTLDDSYISSLQGWLLYLKTGTKKYMDHVHKNKDEHKLLLEIKKYYSL